MDFPFAIFNTGLGCFLTFTSFAITSCINKVIKQFKIKLVAHWSSSCRDFKTISDQEITLRHVSGFPEGSLKSDGADHPPQHHAGTSSGDSEHPSPQPLLLGS